MQYKPSRWWFEFALLYNKIFFVLLSVLLNSDERAWVLLGSLVAITVATLALVAVDKPFRGDDEAEVQERKHKDRAKDLETTLGDKLMLISLVSQLVGYAVAAVCLQSKEARFEEGLSDTSDEVAMFAAVMGLLLVAVQVGGMVYTYRKEKADEKRKHAEAVEREEDEAKPLEPEPEPEPEPEQEEGGVKTHANPAAAK